MKLNVIIPCYNEAGNIELMHEKLTECLKDIKYELIFINDGSKDETENIIKEIYINGEFYKDITNLAKTEVVGGNIDINIENYLVYSKALTVNKENNNYRLTVERYGE